MGARFHNPAVGRFITRDTYRGNIYQPWTQNLYAYCNNNPINYIDPTGHMSVRASFDSFSRGIGQVFYAENWENSYNVAATYLPKGAETFAIDGIVGAENFEALTDGEWNSGDIIAGGLAAFNVLTLRSGGKGASNAILKAGKPGSLQWREAVKAIKEGKGKGINIQVKSQEEAELLIKEAKPELELAPTYSEKTPSQYQIHPVDHETPMPHIKWRDWKKGKSEGAEGHIYWSE